MPYLLNYICSKILSLDLIIRYNKMHIDFNIIDLVQNIQIDSTKIWIINMIVGISDADNTPDKT